MIALGELSDGLLRNPHFSALNKLFEQQVAADVLETKPDETAKRERHYATLQGSRAFMGFLQMFAQQYAELTAKPVEQEGNAKDDDDPGVHDF